jgi:hypothetical protein
MMDLFRDCAKRVIEKKSMAIDKLLATALAAMDHTKKSIEQRHNEFCGDLQEGIVVRRT